ncbi:MAG TPA: bifunctional (p)ppGpp synthetase/guanosine-3',5'-bis(diphosphate) 3'-pyrophosphohydrolase [Clostridiales bacterium]|nr:bifunctional (p)ppGpp synthetase/guanosine-3',5'-bis(diphosphate) 3'-pyrophosphohydrolase [Clostridiales bacterium]
METQKVSEREEVISKIRHYYPGDSKLLEHALSFAVKAHEGQRRESGEPFVTHPIGVADILIDLGMDVATICAALLHDVLEDTTVTEEQLKKNFGDEVCELVKGVTKLDKIVFKSKEEEQAENFRKMFFAMAKDVRVILIKLADRLHNLRTITPLPFDRQNSIAKETLEIYAPLASRLGLSYIKCELEDLSLKVTQREVYEELVKEVNLKRAERQEMVNKIIKQLVEILNELNIAGEVSGRPKHFYSIYRKMKTQNRTFEQIYDLTALRVIVNTVSDCYEVLGKIHTYWKPVPGRFKDYIAVPKPNSYQSLHTTVMTNYGSPFEIQIRTFEMHKIAEYGVAAHWKYKENRGSSSDLDNKISWLREVMDMQSELGSSKEFLESVKVDLYSGQVFVFTPKGDIINLPEGSTPIDFAYNVHTDVGNKCVSAKINGKIVPLITHLKTGDIVEIITSANSKGPSRDWLKIVKTSAAKAKIRSFFKKQMKDENIKLGKDILENELKRRGFTVSQLFKAPWLDSVMQRLSLTSIDDMYAAIGYGGITSSQVIVKLIDFYKKDQITRSREFKVIPDTMDAKDAVVVRGQKDLLVRMAKCCTPVPGDKIIGFISRGRGIVVHRDSCPNIKAMEQERLIEVDWAQAESKFNANVQIIATDHAGLLAKVSNVFAEQKLSIGAMNARISKAGKAIMNVTVRVQKISDLDVLFNRLKQLEEVNEVRRITN